MVQGKGKRAAYTLEYKVEAVRLLSVSVNVSYGLSAGTQFYDFPLV